MEHAAPGGHGFVGREDHGALAAMPIVDDVKEHVGRIRTVGEVADFIDHEDIGMRVRRERIGEAAGAKRG